MSVDAQTKPRQRFEWVRDFEFGATSLVYRKTGVRVPYSKPIRQEFIAWLRYFLAVRRETRRMPGAFTIAFSPDPGRPWYQMWSVARLAGGKLAPAAEADVVFHFEDATMSPNAPPPHKPGAKLINFGCTDISKGRVEQAFAETFGYSLSLNPTLHIGPAVEKSELNAAHDGRIVACPVIPAPGKTYQRVVDNRIEDGLIEDLRCPMVGGKIACVFVKHRPVATRFSNTNSFVKVMTAEQIFTQEEQAKIGEMSLRLGLEVGGLDVLRDRNDGRIFVVDANKTDMGPPIALPLQEKLKSGRMIAKTFREYVLAHFPARGA